MYSAMMGLSISFMVLGVILAITAVFVFFKKNMAQVYDACWIVGIKSGSGTTNIQPLLLRQLPVDLRCSPGRCNLVQCLPVVQRHLPVTIAVTQCHLIKMQQ